MYACIDKLDIDLVERQRGRFVPTSVHRYKVKHQSNMSAKFSEYYYSKQHSSIFVLTSKKCQHTMSEKYRSDTFKVGKKINKVKALIINIMYHKQSAHMKRIVQKRRWISHPILV